MPSILGAGQVFAALVGGVDLSNYMRLGPDEELDLADVDYFEPVFSRSPLREGAEFVLDNVGAKEFQLPLFLNQASKDALHDLVATINRALEDGDGLFQFQDFGASDVSVWTLIRGRWEPATNYRRGVKNWQAGVLRLWCQPYATTGTTRIAATAAATGALVIATVAGLEGDADALLDVRVTAGSYMPSQGRVVAVSVLPPGMVPRYPAASIGDRMSGATLIGASGAAGSQYLGLPVGTALASGVVAQLQLAAPDTVRGKAQRMVVLARAGMGAGVPIRAFDPEGNPLGPTAVVPAQADWSLIDLGTLRLPAAGPSTVKLPLVAAGASGAIDASSPSRRLQLNEIYLLPDDSTALAVDRAVPDADNYGLDTLLTPPRPAFVTGRIDGLGQTWRTDPFVAASGLYVTAQQGAGLVGTGMAANILDRAMINDADAVVTVQHSGFYDGAGRSGHRMAGSPSGAWVGSSLWVDLTVGRGTQGAPQALSIVAVQIGATTVIASVAVPTAAYPVWAQGALAARMVGGQARLALSVGGSVIASCGASHALINQPYRPGLVSSASQTAGPLHYLSGYAIGPVASSPLAPGDLYAFDGPGESVARRAAGGDYTGRLDGDTRGPIPKLAAGSPGRVAALVAPLPQGPTNDVASVEVRVRERFRYMR